MCFYNLKRKSLIFIVMLLALVQGNSIPAGVLGGRRRLQGGEGKNRGLEGLSAERLQGLPRLPGGIRRKKESGQEKEIEPDHNPSLAHDDQGNAYLVWERGNELFWAVNQGGTWTRTGKMPGEGGNRPIVVIIPQAGKSTATSTGQDPSSDQNASGDQSEPASLFCAWESFTAPKKIMGSKGTLTGDGGISWSEPQALTGDSHDDYGIALTLDSGNHPLMLWLQRASLEDDADLYYQVITASGLPLDGEQVIASVPSGTETGDQAPLPAPVTADQGQSTPAAPAADGRAAPSPSADGVQDPPSNWVGQVPPPISLTGPIPPFLNSVCVSIILTRLDISIPSCIPFIGDTAELEIAYFLCGNSGITPRDPSPFLTPAVVNELVAVLDLGPHLSLGFDVFNLGEVAIPTSASPAGGCRFPVEETLATVGGSTSFLYLSNPIPLNLCGQQVGTTRVGVAGAAGISFSYARFPNNPETPREFDTQIVIGMGPQDNFSSLSEKFQGFVLLAGAYVFTHTISNQGYSVSREPVIVLNGALRFGGDWAALLYRFNMDWSVRELAGRWRNPDASAGKKGCWRTPWWADPNSPYFQRISPWFNPAVYWGEEPAPSEQTAGLLDPNFSKNQGNLSLSPKPLMVQSRKDRLRKTMTRVMADSNILVDEVLELVKEPLIGTGGVYEGKAVLGDISGDIYNDGLPSVARSKSGEILAVWAKALPASSLGTRIYAATYTGEGWSSPVEVTPEIDFHQHPALVFDSRGTPLAVWSSSSNDDLDYERSSVEAIFQAFGISNLLYSQRIDGRWTLPKPLAKLPGTNEQVALAAGPNGEIAAVWVNQSGKDSCVYGSLWNGSQWSEPRVISRPSLAESPAVAYTTAHKPFAVWAQDKDGKAETADDWGIYTASWDGTSWHARQMSIAQEPSGETKDDAQEENPAGLKKIRSLPAVPSGRRRKTGRRRG